jgi:peptide/nickel transport system ATP-binding protein
VKGSTSQALIRIRNLTKIYASRKGLLDRRQRIVEAVSNLNLEIRERETLGVVGESGCGKTTLGRLVMGILPPTQGNIEFTGGDRIREMQMVFQNPYSSFDPRFTIFQCVAEPLITHTDLRGDALRTRVTELLENAGMPGRILNRYPHEFSGGQLQRVAIARAIALNPRFIVLDEPTSALDVSVQAQMINLLQSLQKELNLTYMFISHDLGVVRHMSDRVAVMYLGRIVELSSSKDLFAGSARHPYTQALLRCIPTVAKDLQQERMILPGGVPDPAERPSGCSFHPRCPYAFDRCRQEEPELLPTAADNPTACHLTRKKERQNNDNENRTG